MHILSFKIRNFKAFRESAAVELEPLTVFAGVNSSGKSSFIHGLLLLKQSLMTEHFPRLRLTGMDPGEVFVEFSTFEEAIHRYAPPGDNQLGFGFQVWGPMPEGVAKEFFRGELSDAVMIEDELQYALMMDVDVTFRYDEEWGAVVDCLDCQASCGSAVGPRLTAKMTPGGHDKVVLTSAVYDWPEEWVKALDLEWSGIFPSGLYLPSLLEALGELVEENGSSQSGVGGSKKDVSSEISRMLNETEVVFRPLNWLSRELRASFHYLESLRPEPRAFYRIDPNPPLRISARGDKAFQRLWYDREKPVELVAPGHEGEVCALGEALNRVLECLGIGQPLSIVPMERLGFQLRFQTIGGERDVSITDVGFGISQILPVLLVCLKSEVGDTIIIEHPEIHLHPNAQALLADYFIELALSDRRVIVETHSHYFIDRLVRRMAERSELHDKISILFVRPPDGVRGATIAPLEVGPGGDICNWPADFFPEPDEDAARTLEMQLL